MSTLRSSLSGLEALAARWHRLAVILVAYARQVAKLQQFGGRGAGEKAEELELAARAMLVMINRDIATIQNSPDAETEAGRAVLGRLYVISVSLLRLALVAGIIRERLALAGKGIGAFERQWLPALPAAYRGAQFTSHASAFAYFDTS